MNWLPKQSVVVPVDFSDDSWAAVDTALELVDSASAIHVVHVLVEMAVTEPGVVWETVDNASRAEHASEALQERLSDPKYDGAEIVVEFGDPGHQIAEYAERVGAELIVMPSHGRTGLARLLVGSVAERVTRLAHCPVLVLRK